MFAPSVVILLRARSLLSAPFARLLPPLLLRRRATPKGQLCPACQELQDYALARIDKCPFMETKTFCSACKVHCYKPAMREQIRAVMRWAGPRMLPVHPVLSVKHVAVTLKAKRETQKTDA